MTWNDAASGSSGLFEGGFGWGGALLVIGMVVALAIVSGLGILARLRDRAGERKAFDAKGSANSDPRRSDTAAPG
jgi:cytochrome b